MKNYKFLIFIIIFFFLKYTAVLGKENNDFVILGHIYPIIEDKEIVSELYNKINEINPKFVFILGDSNLNNKEIINNFKMNINAELFYTLGNQEYNELKNIDINKLNKNRIVKYKNTNFILLDSNQSSKNINLYLDQITNKINKKELNVILTHHRIWDDSLLSKNKFMHDKSYYFDEIMTKIQQLNIKYIFAGNSKRQYFRDFNYTPNYGKLNINNIFWVDKIDDIFLYSIGSGDGKPKTTFIYGRILNDSLLIIPEYVSKYKTHEILIKEKNYIEKLNFQKIQNFISKNIFYKSHYLIFLIIITTTLIFVFYRKNKK